MAVIFNLPYTTIFDGNGNPISGGKIYFYVTNTTTPQDTYSDATLQTPNANPVVADSNGRIGPIYLDPTLDYKVVITDADDNVIKTTDPYPANVLVTALNVLDYGAVGDGVTDDAAAIQTAFDVANTTGRATIIFPNKIWKIGTQINIYSNTHVLFDGTFNITTSSGHAFYGVGSFGTQYNLAANVTSGATTIPTTAANGLAVGDFIRILGQRNSISSDADENTRLGYGETGDISYFGEFHQVKSITSTTEFVLDSALLFSDYNINADDETPANNPRASTTIEKFTPLQGVIIDATRAKFVKMGNYTDLFRLDKAYACRIYGGYYDKGTYTGAMINFYKSYMCQGIDNEEFMSPSSAANSFTYNSFRSTSSDYCDFINVKATNGYQSFDYSYTNSDKCSINGAISGKFYNTHGAATTHEGTYGGVFDNLTFTTYGAGISLRGRNFQIGNIKLTHLRPDNANYGIAIYQKWAKDGMIGQIHAVNYHYSLLVDDAAGDGAGESWDKVNLTVGNLVSVNADYDFYCLRGNDYKTTADSGIVINNITSIRNKDRVVYAGDYFNSVYIGNVSVIDYAGTNRLIYLAGEQRWWRIGSVNVINGGTSTGVYYIPRITDTATFGNNLSEHEFPVPNFIGTAIPYTTVGDVKPIGSLSVMDSGHSAINSTMAGVSLIGLNGLGTTNQYLPAIKAISNDSSMTSPDQLTALIVPRATETHTGTNCGTVWDILANKRSNGASPELIATMGFNNITDQIPAISSNGSILLTPITAPTVITGGRAEIYVDTADGDLKVRFANGTVATIATN